MARTTWPMTVTPERQVVFARQAIQRYARGEAQFMPVLMDALGQYLALLRADLEAQPINAGPIARLVADAAPQPVPPPFTQRDADRIYTLMISDPNRWQPILDGVIMPAYSAMLGPITQAALADPVVANAVQAWRSQWLADRRQILVHIPDAVTSQLRTKLDDLANATGTNVDDAQAEVQSMLDTGYPSWANRAELIARTETVAANNQGALASWSAMADAAGVTATKTWLSTPDGRTRPEHAAANGQTVAITGSFTVGGEQVSGPGDGSAANVCNCRCTMTFDIPADAPPAVQEQAQELETQLVAAGSGAPSQTIYFLDGFAVDAPADTAPVADDVQDAPTGVAVMAMLSAADAATLAQDGGEAPEDLHCTLGYLAKDAVEYSDDVKAGLVEALASAWTGPVPAKAFATAVFNASDPEREPCSVLLVQSDELAAAHQGISDAIGGLASTTFPIWIPHTALAYNAATPLPPELAAGQTLTYDRLILAWGADHIDLTDQSLTAATEAPVTTPAPTAPPADVVAPGNDGSATGGDTATALSPDLTPIGQTWSGPLAQLGIPSSDGRIIKPGGGTIRPLPLPLSWQRESGYGHEDSTITGRILAVEDRGDVLWGSGDYMDPMLNFDAQQAMAQVDAGLGMISVDIVPTAVGFADAEGNPIDPALYQGDPDGVNAVAVEWEFCGATLVSVQAFPLARIVNDPAPEVQPGAADMMIPGDFAGATPEGPVLADAGDSITLQDGSTVVVGDVVGLGDVDGDGDDDTGAITAINAEAATVDVQLLPDGDNDADDDPENPVTMTVPISSLVPPPATPTNKPGSDEAPPAGLAATSETFAEGEPMPDTVDEDFALLASSYSQPYRAEFFRKQTLDGPTAIQLDRETGQVFGHLGAFGVCHVAKLAETGMCVTVPEGDDFSMFHLGEVVTEDGPIQVGKITVGGGHYGAGGVRGAIEHYDRTSSIAAPVRAYYDEYGIQVCGQLLHGIDPHKVDELMAAGQLSGDWRGRSPNRKLVAALAVNQGSFPVERISPIVGLDANGEQTSLVAAGIVYPPEPDNDITLPSGAKVARSDFETLVASMMETIDRSKVAAAPVTDELKLRRAKARLRLHSLASGE